MLFSAERFTTLQKGLKKKIKILKSLHIYIHNNRGWL